MILDLSRFVETERPHWTVLEKRSTGWPAIPIAKCPSRTWSVSTPCTSAPPPILLKWPRCTLKTICANIWNGWSAAPTPRSMKPVSAANFAPGVG